MKENWRVWDKDKEYGDLFFKRAIGESPEMESSKAVAKIVKGLVTPNTLIVDVGCGSGHYLRSLDKVIQTTFRYHGIDQTEYYISQAQKAFGPGINLNSQRIETKFSIGDIYKLPLPNNSAEIVMCNNVLLHLPNIETPIKELIRVSKKYVVIRMLIGESSFRIKQIELPEEYDENGEPKNFHYYNIYSENYISATLSKHPNIKFTIKDDIDFNPENLGDSTNYLSERPDDLTTILGGFQLNVYVLQPWKFVIIEKNPEANSSTTAE